VVCAVLSLIVAVIFEDISWDALVQASWPILYSGIFSSGVAFTFQVMAQRHTHPAHASIIMSLEAVFAAIGGWLLLNEILSMRGLAHALRDAAFSALGKDKVISDLGYWIADF
jgi:drug/metabolite transporter (DMT)-like permease